MALVVYGFTVCLKTEAMLLYDADQMSSTLTQNVIGLGFV